MGFDCLLCVVGGAVRVHVLLGGIQEDKGAYEENEMTRLEVISIFEPV